MISRKTIQKIEPDFEAGEIVLIDKAVRKSSFDCVYKVRKATGAAKVGHTGTLDPNATGLVIVCTGRKTKEISLIQGLEKAYTGIIALGKTTESYDSETEVTSESSYEHVTEEQIFKARNKFTGSIIQIPPMYSAIKKNGKALYHFARKGVDVERKPREVTVLKFDITEIDLPNVHFEITCSKGTYIRSIANDLGAELGCGAYLKTLRRTRVGEYNVDDALTIDEFKEFAQRFSLVSSEIN